MPRGCHQKFLLKYVMWRRLFGFASDLSQFSLISTHRHSELRLSHPTRSSVSDHAVVLCDPHSAGQSLVLPEIRRL